MSYTEQQLAEMVSAARRMPYGRAQIAAVEEIIRHADAAGLPDLQYAARMLGTNAYQYGAEPAKAFVTFSWCLAVYDRGEADSHYDHNLYWHFKWMVSSLTMFPEVPLARTHAVLDDMERRYRRSGHTMNPVHQYRWVVASHVGDVVAAEEQYRLWCAAPRGEMSDCAGCEPTSKLEHLAWRGRDEEAVALAMPVLGGDLTCVEQPQTILTALLLPYVRTGRLDEAADAHRRAYRVVHSNRAELSTLADHIEFLVVTGNHARALDLVERHLGWLDEAPTPYADMRFSASAALALRRVGEAGHRDIEIRRPALRDREASEVTLAELAEELAERALGLSAAFDARNGTSAQGDRIRALLDAQPIVEHLPLSGPVRRATRAAATRPAPQPTSYPDSPEELVELAERESRLENIDAADAVWQHFDEVCPQPGPALLARRLGARAVRLANSDPAAAEAAWARAAELFGEVGDEVRQQAMLGYIGLLCCLTDRADEGLPKLTASTDRIADIGSVDQQARARVRLATAFRACGRTEDAVAALVVAAQLADQAGVVELCADIAVRMAECMAAEGEQHWGEAIEHAERGVALYRLLGTNDAVHSAQLLLANLRAAGRDFDAAYAALGEAAAARNQALRGRVLHTRGKVALDLDRPQDASDALSDAVADLSAAGEVVHAAYARVDLAAAFLWTERPDEAADVAEEAIPELDLLGDAEEASRARFMLARAYRGLGQHDDALELLDRVVEHCVASENAPGVGQMNTMAGEILDRLDRDAEAARRYAAAADAYGSAQFERDELANRRRAALSWMWAGEREECLAALDTADGIASRMSADEPDAIWARAMLGYDGARILANFDQYSAALDRITAAAAQFRSLDATIEAAIADTLHGRVLVDLERPAEAEVVLAAALERLPEDAAGPRGQIEAVLAQIRT